MLRFTKQVDYGLMAMQYVAAHQGDGAVGVKQIADEFRIPRELLAKVLQRLAKRGLLVSQTGPRGGYRPKLVPAEVTIGQVIRALEGPVAIIQAAITDLLDTLTLAELIGAQIPEAVGGDAHEEVAAHAWH